MFFSSESTRGPKSVNMDKDSSKEGGTSFPSLLTNGDTDLLPSSLFPWSLVKCIWPPDPWVKGTRGMKARAVM